MMVCVPAVSVLVVQVADRVLPVPVNATLAQPLMETPLS